MWRGREGRKLGPAPCRTSHGAREPESRRSALTRSQRSHCAVSCSSRASMPKPLPSGAGDCVAVAAAIPPQSQPGGGGRVTLLAGRGRGRGQRRSQRAGGKRTCSSPRPVPDLLLVGVPTGGQAIRECLVACSSLLGHTQCPLANITCAFGVHHVWDASLNELGSRAHWRRSVQ